MIQLIHEAGIGGWLVILFTITGLAATTTVGRRWNRPGTIAAVWAVVILAAGASGFGAGQRSTDRAINRSQPPGQGDTGGPPTGATAEESGRRVAILSRGTAEAAGNLLLAGQGALLVLLVGGVMVLFRKKEAPVGVHAPAPGVVPVKAG